MRPVFITTCVFSNCLLQKLPQAKLKRVLFLAKVQQSYDYWLGKLFQVVELTIDLRAIFATSNGNIIDDLSARSTPKVNPIIRGCTF